MLVHAALFVSILGVVVGPGCSSPKEAPAATGSAAARPASSATLPGDAAAEIPTKPPGDAAAVDDPAVRDAYRAGMRKGRKATAAKRYAEAIAGFDAALVAKPNDARALGERGFARLLEGSDLAAATSDFDAAAAGTKDPKHLSTIWFNRGLTHEKRGEADQASVAFGVANLLRPTKAAAAKLAGKSACVLDIGRMFEIEDHPPVKAADWLALARALPLDEDAQPATAEAALEALTDAKSEPALPTIVTARSFAEAIAYVVWRSGGQLFATPIGIAWGGRCPGTLAFEIASSTPTAIHVRGAEMMLGGHTYMCEDKAGELFECAGTDDEVSAGTACLGGGPTLRDLVVDRATGQITIVIEEAETGRPRPTIELTANALTIRGRGCDRTEAL
ncbi:MAG: tetratricopeptide repeat protein [Myxococcota bacterium]|nr:tetratricopeptide repeat protein [Myxococcota bacterium]